VISNITGKNQWENCISLDFYFRGLSGPQNQQKFIVTGSRWLINYLQIIQTASSLTHFISIKTKHQCK
jgi:hypothetical protein